MISEVYFITGNKGKFEDASQLFLNSGFKLLQHNIPDIPEIQSLSSLEISNFSAEFVSKTFNHPFFVMDRSFHIPALNGFPGPFVKFINKWLTAEQILKLILKNDDLSAFWNTSISLYIPDKGIQSFESKLTGKINFNLKGDSGYTVDKIFVPDGYSKSISEFTKIDSYNFWNRDKCWKELISYLKNETI